MEDVTTMSVTEYLAEPTAGELFLITKVLEDTVFGGKLYRKDLTKLQKPIADELVARGVFYSENVKGQRHIEYYGITNVNEVRSALGFDVDPVALEAEKAAALKKLTSDPTEGFYAVDFRPEEAVAVYFEAGLEARKHAKQYALGSFEVVHANEWNEREKPGSFLDKKNLAGVPYRLNLSLDQNVITKSKPATAEVSVEALSAQAAANNRAEVAATEAPLADPTQLPMYPAGDETAEETAAAVKFAGGWQVGALDLMKLEPEDRKTIGRMVNKKLVSSVYDNTQKKSFYKLTTAGELLVKQAPEPNVARAAVGQPPLLTGMVDAPAQVIPNELVREAVGIPAGGPTLVELVERQAAAAAAERLTEALELQPTTAEERELLRRIAFEGYRVVSEISSFGNPSRADQAANLCKIGALKIETVANGKLAYKAVDGPYLEAAREELDAMGEEAGTIADADEARVIVTPAAADGWASAEYSGKNHFYRVGSVESICGEYPHNGQPVEVELANPGNCKACLKELKALKDSVHEFKPKQAVAITDIVVDEPAGTEPAGFDSHTVEASSVTGDELLGAGDSVELPVKAVRKRRVAGGEKAELGGKEPAGYAHETAAEAVLEVVQPSPADVAELENRMQETDAQDARDVLGYAVDFFVNVLERKAPELWAAMQAEGLTVHSQRTNAQDSEIMVYLLAADGALSLGFDFALLEVGNKILSSFNEIGSALYARRTDHRPSAVHAELVMMLVTRDVRSQSFGLQPFNNEKQLANLASSIAYFFGLGQAAEEPIAAEPCKRPTPSVETILANENGRNRNRAAAEAAPVIDRVADHFVKHPTAFPYEVSTGPNGERFSSPGISQRLYLAARAPKKIPSWFKPDGERPVWSDEDVDAALVRYFGDELKSAGEYRQFLEDAQDERREEGRRWDIRRAGKWPLFWADLVLAEAETK